MSEEEQERLRDIYGLEEPVPTNDSILSFIGDFGASFALDLSVSELAQYIKYIFTMLFYIF
ncbi:hypothetical protein [Paenibacillus sp. 453mf]|uniref:hypothetical protein n=1 Tax=Paenibacillus sp. 453mf TaxID=1761874 RepID=UPI0008F1790F|nr:hypothetical protein [Paenibacillus sp. 453mf]SFS36479.1 hypothetical protein SAMN04488601_10171 [Paenibacillus sp. 453mf]